MTAALLHTVATSKADWYLMRGCGFVTLLLLTATVALGVVGIRRWQSAGWPQSLVTLLHRNLALLATSFLGLHIATALLDSWIGMPWFAAVVPFTSSWSPFWVGLGAVAFDLALAVTVTSLVRRHLGYSVWRAVHWLAWLLWPVALLHALGAGTDSRHGWGLLLVVLCVAVVVVAGLVRLLGRPPLHERQPVVPARVPVRSRP